MPIYQARISGTFTDNNGKTQTVPSDFALAQKGPCLQATLKPLTLNRRKRTPVAQGKKTTPEPQIINGLALIDTGATSTCVDEHSAKQAGLAIVDRGSISSASHSNHQVPIFAGEIELPSLGTIRIHRAFGVQLAVQGLIALIGRDALRRAILIYSGLDGSFSLSL